LDIPELGELLYQNTEGTWQPAEFFNQHDIKMGKIKYIHDITKSERESENLQLKIFADGLDSEMIAKVQINILKVEIDLVTESIDIRNESTIILTNQKFEIRAQSIGGDILDGAEKFEFCFTSLPILAKILVNNTEIRKNRMIRYEDVIAGNVKIVIGQDRVGNFRGFYQNFQ